MIPNKWIAHERIDEKNKINLLCFIFDGGSASYFAPWKYGISEKINLIPILYPVREKRRKDPMYENMDAFVKDLVESLPEIFKNRYAFFGYCSGSIMAYEAAVYAKKLYGTEPEYGMIVSSEAPEFLCESVPVITPENSERLFFEHMSGLPFIDEKTLKDPVFLRYYKPLFAADYGLLNTYRYEEKEKLNCDFDVIMCPDDPKVEKQRVDRWRTLTNGKTEVIEKEGGHFLVDMQQEYIFETLNRKIVGVQDKRLQIIENTEETVDREATEMEAQVISIWQDVFNRDDIHPSDHFFLKGGDSLKAVKIINAVKAEFAVEVNINDIFNNPRIEDFANLILKRIENKQDEMLDDADEGEL